MNGLVFIVPNVVDLLWAGRSDTIQLVSIGSISKPFLPLSKFHSISNHDNNDNNDNNDNQHVSSPSSVHHDPASLLNISSNDNYLASVDYRYSSPEHTGRTGNPIDTRSVILYKLTYLILLINYLLFYLFGYL